jgi:NAD(P)-dependent dehydrogenase (short-subunit alcohol dehydrogenase family)
MKIAVVTGSGRGLGRSIAQGLANKGFTVLVTDIDELAAADTARHIGRGAWSTGQDVRDPGSHERVARIASARGPIGIWVNNAGVLHTGTSWQMDEEAIRRQVDINLMGVIWGSRAAVGVMGARGGQLINIASLSALAPTPGLAVYGATKHAVLGFSLSLQGELDDARVPVRVSVVCPDAIDTTMVRNVAGDRGSAILFSARRQLTVEGVTAEIMKLVDQPRLLAAFPRHRALLTHLARPFPALGLKVLAQFRKLGERHRQQRANEPPHPP